MAKRVSTRKIKKHRLYTYDEAGGALGITPHTVSSWRSAGLPVMTASKPHYILGAELINYLEKKQAKRSVKLGLVSLIPKLIPIGAAFGLWGIYIRLTTLLRPLVLWKVKRRLSEGKEDADRVCERYGVF